MLLPRKPADSLGESIYGDIIGKRIKDTNTNKIQKTNTNKIMETNTKKETPEFLPRRPTEDSAKVEGFLQYGKIYKNVTFSRRLEKRRPQADLIFVTDITDYICGEKSVMWRNFKFLYMKHVEKAKISPHVDHMWIRAIVWRKI